MTDQPTTWREANTITDWEFSEIGALLCDHAPRDLALMIVRLQESHRIGEETYSDLRQMREQMYVMWKQLKAAQEDIRKLEGSNPMTQTTRRVRHKKRGTTYEVIGTAELQMATDLVDGAFLTIYRGEDGKWWARQEDEFEDGRFEEVQNV
jgi:hypothetical protein